MGIPDEILSHRERLLDLARHLVGDPHRAEDLVHDTLLSALEHGDGRRRTRRGLRETLRLKAREALRQEVRRERRERAAASRAAAEPGDPDGAPATGAPGGGLSPAQTTRLESDLLAAVAREMSRLEEPYRTTLRLRFFDEVPPRAIAERQGVPVQTVYTRIARGSALLRSRLDRRLVALAPLLPDVGGWSGERPAEHPAGDDGATAAGEEGPERNAGETSGARAGDASRSRGSGAWHGRNARRVALSAAAVAAVAAAALLSNAGVVEGEPRPALVRAGGAATGGSADVALRAREVARRRPRAAERPETATAGSPTTAGEEGTTHLRGRVLDHLGRPFPGATVALEEGPLLFRLTASMDNVFGEVEVVEETTSGPDGSFALTAPPGAPDFRGFNGRVVARAPGFAPLLEEMVPADRGSDELVPLVAPSTVVRGRILDGEGSPVPAAGVRLRPPADLVAGLGRRMRTWLAATPSTETDDDGRFALEDAYALAGSRLEVHREDFRRTRVLAAGETDVEIRLGDVRARPPAVRGFVLTADYEPVDQAAVYAGRMRRLTGPDGAFELAIPSLAEAGRVHAVAPGMQPVTLELPRLESGAVHVPPELLLVASEPSLSITGRVVDSDGRPVPKAWVWLRNPTPIEPDVMAGFAETRIDPDRSFDVPFAVVANENGWFSLRHLVDREYRLGAMERSTLRSSLHGPIPAGTRDLELVVPTDAPLEPLEGRVVDVAGEPMAGVSVAILRFMMDLDDPGDALPGGVRRRAFQVGTRGTQIETGADGRFRLPAAPAAGCDLRITGRHVAETWMPVPPPGEREGFTIVAPRRARMGVVVPARAASSATTPDGGGDPAPVPTVALLGPDRSPVPLRIAADEDRAMSLEPAFELPLESGRLELIVPETVRTAVLRLGGRELDRRPVRPVPGARVEVRLAPGVEPAAGER